MAFTTFDNAPYLYRKSGGGGDKEIDKLVGGTIAWNQLVESCRRIRNNLFVQLGHCCRECSNCASSYVYQQGRSNSRHINRI